MWPGPVRRMGLAQVPALDRSTSRSKRMGLDYVDIFYSHRPDPETPIEETMGALATAVKSGKALYAGISNYDPEQTRAAAAALAAEGVPLLIHQPRYNMFDRTMEDGLLARARRGRRRRHRVLAARPGHADRPLPRRHPERLARGGGSLDQREEHRRGLPRARRARSTTIAQGRGQTLAQLALTWVLRHPQVTSALIGASSVAQLESSLAALDFPELTRRRARRDRAARRARHREPLSGLPLRARSRRCSSARTAASPSRSSRRG